MQKAKLISSSTLFIILLLVLMPLAGTNMNLFKFIINESNGSRIRIWI